MSVNKATLLGNVGNDPEVKHFDNGGMVANFSMATTEKWKDKDGEKQERTEWHRVAVFGKLAEVVEKYVKKGQQLYIEGKIKTRKWEKGGVDHYTTEIVLNGFGDTLQMIGGRPQAEQGAGNPPQQKQEPEADNDSPSDDLPF